MTWERILDVNVNRFNESLKFLEDILRFQLESKDLLVRIREIRHDFLYIKKVMPIAGIIIFRKSQEDLGRKSKYDPKKGARDLIVANLTRAKESSRIIEEILRTKQKNLSNRMKEIRFKIYDLEKDIVVLQQRRFNPKIYAIIDEKYIRTMRIEEMVGMLENYGVTMIQLRIKTLPDREFMKLALKVKRSITNPEIKFIINNRVDIAQLSGADGVHLGQRDIPITEARNILTKGYIIGISAHKLQEAVSAEKHGADYLGVGAIFKTKTKNDAKVCGLSVLKSICEKVSIPVIGIGGINSSNYQSVFKAGAAGVAISSYLFEGDLKKNIRSLTRFKI